MKTLTPTQIIIMAATAGIAVANVYYSQPILQAIATYFHIDTQRAGIISVLSQIGYGLGLFFLTPIGDMIERKKLILYLQGGLMVALFIMAFAPNIYVVFFASLLIGIFSVVAQVILPMAASLVTENRGKVVGQIFTGLLIGILSARVFSGFITNWLGWQYVYILSAGMVFVTGALMQADFPSTAERFNGSYLGLLRSTVKQLERFAILRKAALTGMIAFGTLSAFWVTLTFYLSGQPFSYKPSQIGLFGLLAAAGALIAPVFGKLADKGNPHRSLLFSTSLTFLSIVMLKLFPDTLVAICVTVILLDIGAQATQVTNIALIYSLDNAANSRINTVYMTSYFIGGALGSYGAIQLYNMGGWAWSVGFMILLSVAGILNAFTLAPQKIKAIA